MLLLPPDVSASSDGYGQAARLLRPGLVDPKLSPPASDTPPPRPMRSPEDVVEGLPLPGSTRSDVLAAIGAGTGGFQVASHLRRLLADQPPALVREVVERTNRFAAFVRERTPRPARPVLGVSAALGLRKSGVGPPVCETCNVGVGPPPARNRAEHPFVGTVTFQGMRIRLENLKGSERSGTDADGKAWSVQMPAHYGEFAATQGTDGDPVDVFVGDDPRAPTAYVFHLQNPASGEHDEDKVFLGFPSAESARACFRAAYDRRDLQMDPVRAIPIPELTDWLKDRGNRGRKVDGGRSLAKSGVIKVGPHGGQIIGYAHGDQTKPLYAGKNPELTHAHVYKPGAVGAAPVHAQVHDVHGPYAWTVDPAVTAAGPAVVHLPTGRVVKAVAPAPGAAGPKSTASAAVKALSANHGTIGLDAPPGGFTSKADYATMRAAVVAAESTPKAPAPAVHAPPSGATTAKKGPQAPAGPPLDKAAADVILAHVTAKTGMSPEAIRAALTAPDAGMQNEAVAQNRARIEHAILTGGHARKHAILELLDGGHHAKAAVDARLDAIGTGDIATLKKEYAATPVYDLQILSGAKASGKYNPNGAVCFGSRHVEMGLGEDGKYVTGNFRHELGHAVMMSWGYQNGGSAPPESPAGVVLSHYKAAKAKMAAAPKAPAGGYDHEWYELNTGVIGSRALDTAHEDAAEHYRGYHREVLRHRFKQGGQLDTYHQRHPEMGALWDARYTAALLASAASKGVW